MNNNRTIRVTGRGRLKIRPDMTRIKITLEGVFWKYDETLRKSSEATEQMKNLLGEFGFQKSDLKTLNFEIDTEYESYKSEDTYKQRFVGYKYEHVMKVEFDSDNERLGKILYALAHSPLHPEFRISYTVKDEDAAKNELLGKAVKDAKEKAVVLTRAAGVTLTEIQNIDYSWGEVTFESRPMDRMMMADVCCSASDRSYDLDIEPDDIDVSDTVTVIWGIQ